MVDVAELGLSIDSRQAGTAAGDLNKLSQSAERAQAAFNGIERAAGMADQKSKEYAQTLQRAYGLNQELTQSQVNQIRAYETQIGKQTLLNDGRKREAAQFEALRKAQTTGDTEYGKVVADLAAKQYDLQQKTEVSERSSSNLANTLTRRFVLGFVVSQIKNMVSALFELAGSLEKVQDVAQRAGASSQSLQGLQAAFGYKGGDTAAFLDQFQKFGQEVDKAKRGVGDLAALFRLNGQTVADSTTSFLRVADLVKQAGTEADKFKIIQEAGLTPSRELVKTMEQGSAELRKQIELAGKFSDAQLENQRAVKEAYDKFIVDWTQKFKSAWVSLTEFFSSNSLNKGATGTSSPFSRAPIAADPGYDKPFLGPAPSGTKTKEQTVEEISRAQQYLGLLGQTTTALEARRQVQLQLDRAAVDGIGIDQRRADILKQMAEDQSLGVTAIKAAADALTIEAATVDMSTVAAEAYRATQTAILENRRRGVELAPQELEYLRAQADILAQNKAASEAAKIDKENRTADPLGEMQERLKQLDAIRENSKNGWDGYGDAVARALAKGASSAFGLGAQLATALGTIFNKQKAGAYAAAVLNTAESITKTIATYGATPWGLAAAGVAAAAGAAQIATISRQSYGSTAGGASPSVSATPVAVEAAPTAPEAPQRSVYVGIHGRTFTDDQVRDLIEAINDHSKDGGVRVEVV